MYHTTQNLPSVIFRCCSFCLDNGAVRGLDYVHNEILTDFFFQRNQYPSPKEIASLSKQVGLDGKRIKAWFSYKRFSEKKRASKSSGKKPTRIKELPPNLKRILTDFFFQRNQNPNKQQKIDLATKVGLDLEKITRWFSDTRFQENKKRGKGHSSGTAVEKILSHFFQSKQNPSPKEISSLSKQVGLDGKMITCWFSSKRFQEKKREAKSSGKKPTRIKELPPNLKRILTDFFQRNQYPNKQEKINLATKVGLDLEKITRWFSNKRFQENEKREKGHSSGTTDEKREES